MPDPGEPQGIALVCNWEGAILRVIRDTLGRAEPVQAGSAFETVVHPDTRLKARHFLAAIRETEVAFDWEMNLLVQDAFFPLSFTGVAENGHLVIAGAGSRANTSRFLDGLLSVNNDSVNGLRSLTRKLHELESSSADREAALYDELSRLNADLLNAQRELARQNARLASLNEDKNRFLGMAAHDLRNPLGVVLTYSHLLSDGSLGPLNQAQQDMAKAIRQSAQFMTRLVNDLLDASAIEAGHLTLQREPTDLSALLARVVNLNGLLAGTKQVTLAYCAGGRLPVVSVDPVKIEQVLNNLLGNAIKFAPKGSTVELTAETSAEEVVVTVRDQGQGIPELLREHLFKPFMAGHQKGTAGEAGTGLGLAIAKRIIGGHGGRIWFESPPGMGTSFFLALPLRQPAQEADA